MQESNIRQQLSNLQLEKRQVDDSVRNLKDSLRMIQTNISKLTNDRQAITSAKDSNSKTVKYGQNFPMLLNKISQHKNNFHGPVIGPLGVHVALREGCDHLSFAIERAIERHLSSFIVTNMDDQQRLKQLIDETFGNRPGSPRIIIQVPEPRFDKEIRCIPNITTVLSAINIDNDMVFNCLVNLVRPEGILLVENEDEMKRDGLQRDKSGNLEFRDGINRAISHIGILYTYRYGNQSAEEPTSGSRRLLSTNEGDIISDYDEQIHNRNQELIKLENSLRQEERRVMEYNNELQRYDQDAKMLHDIIRKDLKIKSDLQLKLDEVREISNIDTTMLENEEIELMSQLKLVSNKIETSRIEHTRINSELKVAKEDKAKVDRQKDEVNGVLSRQENKLINFINESTAMRATLKKLETQLSNEVSKLDEVRKILNEKEECTRGLIEEARDQTRQLIPDWDGNPIQINHRETTKELERMIKSIRCDLHQQKQELLARMRNRSLEMLTEEFEQSNDDLRRTETSYTTFCRRIDELSDDYTKRSKKWSKKRSESGKIVSSQFDQLLQGRGFSGKVDFLHAEKPPTVNFVVQIDNSKDETRTNDVRQISGGERSYVALCFLLALSYVVSEE